MAKVTMIKSDAVVNIKIGSGFLNRLQKVMFGIMMDKSPEEIEDFKKQSEDIKNQKEQNPDFTEDWMNHLFTLTVLINEVEQTIINEGMTFEKEMEDGNLPIIPQDDSLPDQSQLQPE